MRGSSQVFLRLTLSSTRGNLAVKAKERHRLMSVALSIQSEQSLTVCTVEPPARESLPNSPAR
jgi:hypothetical protein